MDMDTRRSSSDSRYSGPNKEVISVNDRDVEKLIGLGFLAGIGYLAYKTGLLQTLIGIGHGERVPKVASKLQIVCPKTICADKTNECRVVFVPDQDYQCVIVNVAGKKTDGSYDFLLQQGLENVVKGHEYDIVLAFIGNGYIELDAWITTCDLSYQSPPEIIRINPQPCLGEQPPPSEQPPKKPSPQPQPPPSKGLSECIYYNTAGPCVEKLMNQLYYNGSEKYKWDASGHIEFDVDIPEGCKCCFDIDALIDTGKESYFQGLRTIGPYTGAQHIELDVQLPPYTKDIKIWPRCKGTPHTPPPRPVEPCTLRKDKVWAAFDPSMNAVNAGFSGTIKSNCYNCDCVAKVYAESLELCPQTFGDNCPKEVAECFTAYGHSEPCHGWATLYSPGGHGKDKVRFYAIVNGKRIDLGEVEVTW